MRLPFPTALPTALLVVLTLWVGRALVAGQDAAPRDSVPVVDAREVRRFSADEARQGIAADQRHLYLIDNRRIGKYDKTTGRRVGGWAGPAGGAIQHLNSGVVMDGRLYAAHSNYPDRPMVSSVEVWDVESMRHVGSHSFGIHAGSLTWIDRRDGAWWVAFANYENAAGEAGRGVEWTVLERYDDQWRRTGGWVFPPSLVARWRPYSTSGGVWGADGRLYVTGHDAPELYVLRLPGAGAALEWVETIRGTHHGQGIARDPADPTLIYGIDRGAREAVVLQLPSR